MNAARNRPRNKVNVKGRDTGPRGRFARLDFGLLVSGAYRSLTPNARALLIELISLHTGQNNGKLWLSEVDAARRMGVADPKVARKAFIELTEAGFIAMTKDAHFNVKEGRGRARQWRLTWLFNNAQLKSATNEWQSFAASSNAANKRMDHGLRAIADYRKSPLQK